MFSSCLILSYLFCPTVAYKSKNNACATKMTSPEMPAPDAVVPKPPTADASDTSSVFSDGQSTIADTLECKPSPKKAAPSMFPARHQAALSLTGMAETMVYFMKGVWPVPHIIVWYNGQKMAYSRSDLRSAGYEVCLLFRIMMLDWSVHQGAQQMFFETFIARTKSLSPAEAKACAKNIRLQACFYQVRGGVDEGMVVLPTSLKGRGWKSLIDNITTMEVLYET